MYMFLITSRKEVGKGKGGVWIRLKEILKLKDWNGQSSKKRYGNRLLSANKLGDCPENQAM